MFATYAKLQHGWLRRSAFFAFLLSLVAGPLLGQTVFINEIHYDNTSKDTGEAIEITGPAGTDLSGWALALYNGRNGALYRTKHLSGVIPDQANGFGTVAFGFAKSIQNGTPDGIALVANGQVVQFLSYEGTFTAVGGPADGMTSTDIQVAESNSTPVEFSLQLKGTGTAPSDFFGAYRLHLALVPQMPTKSSVQTRPLPRSSKSAKSKGQATPRRTRTSRSRRGAL